MKDSEREELRFETAEAGASRTGDAFGGVKYKKTRSRSRSPTGWKLPQMCAHARKQQGGLPSSGIRYHTHTHTLRPALWQAGLLEQGVGEEEGRGAARGGPPRPTQRLSPRHPGR
eukprot:scaffold47636_cov29-Tisochrysis_lutea.AAC.2